MLDITEVKVKKVDMFRTKGIASITINNCFVINDIKILESQKGLFIMMPNKRTPDGEFKDIVHPINQETRDKIQETILSKYMED